MQNHPGTATANDGGDAAKHVAVVPEERPARPRAARGRIMVVSAAAALFVLVSGLVGWATVSRLGDEASTPPEDVTATQRTQDTEAGTSGSQPAAVSGGEGGDAADSGESMTGGAAPEGTLTQVVVQGDEVVRTASLTVTVEDGIETALGSARTVADGAGGFVADMERSTSGGEASATLTIRVPAEKFDATVEALERLGEVTSSTQATEDVTQQSIDIDARLRSLGAEADALRGLLAQAGTTAEILEIRRQLNEITTQIEVLAAQRQALDQQVAMSTISLFLATPGTAVGPEPTGFWHEALGEAWERLEDGVAAILVGAATLAPFALLALGVVAAGRALWRRRSPASGPEPAGTA